MNEMRKLIDIVESENLSDEIIPGELPEYNTLAKQLAAVQQAGWKIQYIRNLSLEVQLEAVKQSGYNIQYITNPAEQVQLVAVQHNGLAIDDILAKGIVPSIAVQRAAVLNKPASALRLMVRYNFPISKMIQWTAAKLIKKRGFELAESHLSKLDPDVQDYLRSNNQ